MKCFRNIFYLIWCVLPLFLAGCTPSVTIILPANGDTFEAGQKIIFKGQAAELQQPKLADDAFVWTSDKDGEIGTGPSIESSELSEGVHSITLTVTFPDGQARQSSVSITIGNDGVPTTTTTIENIPTTTTTIETEPTTTTTIAITGDRFKDNGNGTVTDARTGLVWLKNADPCRAWDWSVEYCCSSLASGMAGLTDGSTAGDWRLPSKEELEGIGTDPPTTWYDGFPSVTWTKPGAPFTDVQSGGYWSGTENAGPPDSAWLVDMYNGDVYSNNKGNHYPRWPVRSDK